MAGIPHAESIVADSIASSSSPSRPAMDNLPHRDAPTNIEFPAQSKRVTKTYGRAKAGMTSGDVVRDDVESRARILKTAPRDADAHVIPESDDANEHIPSFDGSDWRAKLKAIDEDHAGSGEIAAKNRIADASTMLSNDVSSVEESFQPPPMSLFSRPPHLSIANLNQHKADTKPFVAVGRDSLFSSSQCTFSTLDPSSRPSRLSRGREPPSNEDHTKLSSTHERFCPSHKRVLTSPESSDDGNTSPKHPYAINSPGRQSSPTPPTSPLLQDSMLNGPVVSEGESTDDPSKRGKLRCLSKGKSKEQAEGSEKWKKAPTKKEVLETKKESARLLADQRVSIRRADVRSVHTIANLFNKLKSVPMIVAKHDSDPITSFSSPQHLLTTPARIASSGDVSPTRVNVVAEDSSWPSMPHLRQNSSAPEIAERPNGNDSEEDMPDPASLAGQEEKLFHSARRQMERAGTERRAKELQIYKRKALELSKTQCNSKVTSSKVGSKACEDSSSDNELEIVEDMVSLPILSRDRLGTDVRPAVRTPRDKGVGKEGTQKSEIISQKRLELAARPTFISVQDKNGLKRKAGQNTSVSHKDLNNLMLQRVEKQSGAIEETKKKQWVKAGGILKEQSGTVSLGNSATDWINKGSIKEEVMEVDERWDYNDGSEYTPENVQNIDTDGSDGRVSQPGVLDDESTVEQHISDDELADTDKENHRPALRRQAARIIVDSDEEDDSGDRTNPSWREPVIYVPDTSFARDDLGSPGEDKENSAELAFDLSEDKENAKVPRHVPRGRVLNPDDASPSPGYQDDSGDRTGREPFSSLDAEGENLLMLPLAQRRESTQARVLQVLHEDEVRSTLSSPVTSAKSKAPFRETSFFSSPGSVDECSGSPPPFLGERFSQLLAGSNNTTDCEEPVSVAAYGEGSFSQFFSPSAITRESPLSRMDIKLFRDRPGPAAKDDDFQFTQPNVLLPSVQISESQRREVDQMFGKDQEFKLDEAKRSREEAKASDTSSPVLLGFRSFPASQLTQLSPRSIRRPLETLSLDSSDTTTYLDATPQDVPHARRRLLRERPPKSQARSSPILAPRNAFDILRDAATKGKIKEQGTKPHMERSDLIETEAQESDEEAMLGFGGRNEDDDEDGGDDPNAIIEGLVDDTPMDEKTRAADLVLEKHMEHQAADDAAVEKLHQDAVAGKLRGKRRDRGLGFEDSDSDEDEYRGPHKPSNKKRRVEGDTLESYGKNPETKAFYDAYQADLMEDADPRLVHLLQAESEPIEEGDGDTDGEPETIDPAEVRRRIRALSRNEISLEPEQDLQDVSWMENEEEVEDSGNYLEIEERPFRLGKSVSETRPSPDHLNCQDIIKSKKMHPAEQSQLKSWASEEAKSRSASGRGGFTRKDDSSGSLRKQRRTATISKAPIVEGDARTNAKSSSLVSRIEKRKGFDS